MFATWKKVAAASNVVAVCLACHQRKLAWKENVSILCHTVGLHHPFRPVECFLGELLDIGLPRGIICHGIFARVLCLGLPQVS
jgi:hypothetical protein